MHGVGLEPDISKELGMNLERLPSGYGESKEVTRQPQRFDRIEMETELDSSLTYNQAQQTFSMINIARSIHDISTCANMYIPLRAPVDRPSSYVHWDPSSQWHLSALLSMAVETMTLPTRQRGSGERTTLDALETSLNVNGNQRIAGLQCSVRHRSTVESPDEFIASKANNSRQPVASLNSQMINHDMDLSGTSGQGSSESISGRVDSLRGYSRSEEMNDMDELCISTKMRKLVTRFPLWLSHGPLWFCFESILLLFCIIT